MSNSMTSAWTNEARRRNSSVSGFGAVEGRRNDQRDLKRESIVIEGR